MSINNSISGYFSGLSGGVKKISSSKSFISCPPTMHICLNISQITFLTLSTDLLVWCCCMIMFEYDRIYVKFKLVVILAFGSKKPWESLQLTYNILQPWKFFLRAQDTTWLVLGKLTNSPIEIVFAKMNITLTWW